LQATHSNISPTSTFHESLKLVTGSKRDHK
jgi:hypothetical protein